MSARANNRQDINLLSSLKIERLQQEIERHEILIEQLKEQRLDTAETALENGLFTWKDKRCKLCQLYIRQCKSFLTSNGKEWIIKSHITCHSKNVIYFLKCRSKNCSTTYIGKTNDFRKRMNNHISSCKNGKSSDRFDNHVFNCTENRYSSTYTCFWNFQMLHCYSHAKACLK